MRRGGVKRGGKGKSAIKSPLLFKGKRKAY